jgi:hypothetical protein
MMGLTHRFHDKEGFMRALNHIRSWAPRMEDGNYVVEFDLQEMLEPLKKIFVEINYRIRRMIFRGDDERAVRALYYDCTH